MSRRKKDESIEYIPLSRDRFESTFEAGGTSALWQSVQEEILYQNKCTLNAYQKKQKEDNRTGDSVIVLSALTVIILIFISYFVHQDIQNYKDELASCKAGDTIPCIMAYHNSPDNQLEYELYYKQKTGKDLPVEQ